MKSRDQPSLFAPADLPPNLQRWEAAAAGDLLAAAVVFNLPLETPYHYLVPDALRTLIQPGQRVEAPFGAGNKPSIGYCVDVTTQPPTTKRLKSITAILDREPLVTAAMLDLTKWIAERYLCGWGQVLNSIIPAGVKSKAGERELTFFRLAEDVEARLKQLKIPAKQQAVIQALKSAGRTLRIDELTEAADCGPGPVRTLVSKGLIVAVKQTQGPTIAESVVPPSKPISLNADQSQAVQAIIATLQAGRHETFVLHGVTGSGKTEVYIRTIAEAVSYGRQAIVLVPEISLTPQTIRRFRSRFPRVAVLHSHLSDSERHAHWRSIASGEVDVVVGARSAVFAPTPHLGIIVIDEEHETSFKQDSTPRYHAREVARRRAEAERVPLILGSATPTLESWLRVQRKQDRLLSLPKRVEDLPLPPVITVDTRNDPRIEGGAAIGRTLEQGIRHALQKKGQVILFLNVRGFSPLLWCRRCGQGVKCPQCDVTLTWHKQRGIALCHSCDYSMPRPEGCPQCHAGALIYLGVGTERLEQEVKQLFPEAKALRMDSDTMRERGSHDRALEAFRHGEVQILLGTQMIAKGLDFPNVTLVGVIAADTLLHQPDLRASERTFQLIAQVAGRTGRSQRGGRVYVQTACPEHPAIQCASRHDYLGFVQTELPYREAHQAPPYAHLVRAIIRGPLEPPLQTQADALGKLLRAEAKQSAEPIRILGPAPCQVTRLHGNYRYHVQMSCANLPPLLDLWRRAASQISLPEGIELAVDVDPINLR
jgi:primosomal protein N' (replication factor Y) (superfamily II helicase)